MMAATERIGRAHGESDMKKQTLVALAAILESDPPRNERDRATLLRALNLDGGDGVTAAPADSLLTFAEAARVLGRSRKGVFDLCRHGHLPRVALPGRQRAAGIRRSDLDAFLARLEG